MGCTGAAASFGGRPRRLGGSGAVDVASPAACSRLTAAAATAFRTGRRAFRGESRVAARAGLPRLALVVLGVGSDAFVAGRPRRLGVTVARSSTDEVSSAVAVDLGVALGVNFLIALLGWGCASLFLGRPLGLGVCVVSAFGVAVFLALVVEADLAGVGAAALTVWGGASLFLGRPLGFGVCVLSVFGVEALLSLRVEADSAEVAAALSVRGVP